MSHPKLKFVNSLLLIATLLLVTSYLSYSFCIAYDLPKIDHWRWIQGLLIPYIEGNISFWEYITREFYAFRHSHIITLGFVWINYKWFNLRYDLDYFLGIISSSIFLFLILKNFLNQKIYKGKKTFQYFSILALTAAFFNTNNVCQESLVQFEYLYLVGAFSFLLIIDKNIRSSKKNIIVFIATIVVFFLGDAMGISAILATIIFYVFFSFKRNFRHQLLVILSALLISFCFAKWLIPKGGSHLRESLVFIFSNPLKTLYLIINCYAQGIIDIFYIENIGKYKNIAQFLIGFGALLFQLCAIFLIVKNNRKNDSWLPLLLILFSASVILGIALTRLPGSGAYGAKVAFASRYIRLHQIGLLGGLWVYLSLLLRSENKMSKYILCVALVVSVISITHTAANHYRNWKMLPQHLNQEYKIAAAIRKSSSDDQIDLGRYLYRCRNKFCEPSIEFLKENELSVFRPSHPFK
jgi:hypothetical protein